ncbi:MAG: T9SS type A sorting domain-containing protein, partial [Microscillaceae bacterium]|nr:T9SS type A sorting domain-containing protein [Microscillaceae bacterium]MDW8461502.1 T9SS type A sorting domain-containing protein [Cytophagales bacterium]
STAPLTTYYVRVMNVSSLNVSVQGKIRITKFAQCNVGPNLVRDGDFAEWGTVGMRATFNNNDLGGGFRYYTGRNQQPDYPNIPIGNPATPAIQYITSANPSDTLLTAWGPTGPKPIVPSGGNNPIVVGATHSFTFPSTHYSAGNYTMIDRYARFATMNGYLLDEPKGWYCVDGTTIGCTTNAERNNTGQPVVGSNKVYHNGGWINNGEFEPEGRYTVGKNPQTWFQPFFSFGVGFKGWGGAYNRPNLAPTTFSTQDPATNTYCADPVRATQDACIGLTGGSSVLALPTPTTNDANFLMVNAWWKTPAQALLYEGNGKLWCQTITVEPNKYFIFNAWFGNMIPVGRNLDLPQLIISICDMEDPANPVPAPPAAPTPQPQLPGETYTDDNFTHTFSFTTPSGGTYTDTKVVTTHRRNYPGTDGGALTSATPLTTPSFTDVPNRARRRTLNTDAPMLYGASRSCNLPGEGYDKRIKYLGTDIYLPEGPDNWIPIRCIYKSPNFSPPTGRTDVRINLCIENRSLTKNGNDLVVDGIKFFQCTDADAATFENYLKGNTCELADAPIPGFALSAKILEFGAFYNNGVVDVRWKNTAEPSLSHFVVERSTDGRNFGPIGIAKAKPDEAGRISSYEYTDSNIERSVRRYFYRLKIMNKSNQGEFGPVTDVLIPMFNVNDLQISPNPIASGSLLRVDYEAQEAGLATIIITDMMGNRFLTTEVKVNGGVNQYDLSTKGLPAGMYIVSVGQGVKRLSKKMVVF